MVNEGRVLKREEISISPETDGQCKNVTAEFVVKDYLQVFEQPSCLDWKEL